jgi:nitrogen fixation-related uncharacterized protein
MEQGLDWNTYLIGIAVLGAVFFCTALYGLAWAAKRGAFLRFDAQALSIFDESEPEGRINDSFPASRSKHRSNTKDSF